MGGRDLTCSDDGDKYRPIKEEGDAGGKSSPKVWKTRPVSEYRYNWKYKGKEWGANYTKDDSTQLWMIPESDPFKVPAVTEEDFEGGPRLRTTYVKVERKWSNFYSSDDYVMFEATNLMIAPTSEEACKDNDGFVCKVGGVKTCFKRGNLCDLHPQCDPVDDSKIAEDELDCDNEYRKKRLIPRQATYRCQSPYHNEDSMRKNISTGVVWIRAALNDGNPECWKEEDEIERSTEWVSYYFPAIALAVLVIVTPFVAKILQFCFRNDFSAPEGVNTTLKTFVNGSPTEVEKVIGERKISSSLAQLQKLDLPRERRRRINRK